VMKRIRIAHNG